MASNQIFDNLNQQVPSLKSQNMGDKIHKKVLGVHSVNSCIKPCLDSQPAGVDFIFPHCSVEFLYILQAISA